jgi:hypothetical protein
MITATKNGRTYEITEDDQRMILLLTVANGWDLDRSIREYHEAKFGEPLDSRPNPPLDGTP